MIDQHTLTTLEFGKVQALIEGKCRTPYGHEAVRNYTPSSDKQVIDRRLNEISQMLDIIRFGAAFPLSRMEDDCREMLERSQVAGMYLDPEELQGIKYHLLQVMDENGEVTAKIPKIEYRIAD